MTESIDALVRRVDEDRWLASRFAEPLARQRLLALYAAYYEIARTPEIVSQDTLGAIRLQWWREGLDAIFGDTPVPEHPVLQALAETIRGAGLVRAPFDALIDAREKDFEQAPFQTWADLDGYIDATAGGVIQIAAQLCDPALELTEEHRAVLTTAGRAWGYVGLVRAAPFWASRNRSFFPANLLAHVGLDLADVLTTRRGHAHVAAQRAVLDRGLGALRESQRRASILPAALFPAVSYVSFAADYAKAILRDGFNAPRRTPLGPLARRLKLVQVTMRGAL
ncbi:MAG: phytoene/squalene synthase family protein [Alphaproteobacteria bacterium]|nr:phytoene/squalene synthase family protein [Alphaproteobacteria bacterium]